VNGAGEDLPGGERHLRHQQHLRRAPPAGVSPGAWRGTSAAADVVVWELACGKGLSLVWAWCPCADFALGPAVKMSFRLSTRVLPCGQAQALWHRAEEAQPAAGGHCRGQLGHLLSFVSIYSTRADLMLTLRNLPGMWHIFI